MALRVVFPSTVRVPDSGTTQQTKVKGALAWSFGLTAKDYDLAQET